MKQICLFIGLTMLAISFTSGCRKKGDTIANIYVLDDLNVPVENAEVVLYGTNTASVPSQVAVFDTAYSNVSGMASFKRMPICRSNRSPVSML